MHILPSIYIKTKNVVSCISGDAIPIKTFLSFFMMMDQFVNDVNADC